MSIFTQHRDIQSRITAEAARLDFDRTQLNDLCPRCQASIAVLESELGSRMHFFVEEDSLTIKDMADIEDQKPVFFDEDRHRRHSKQCKAKAEK